MEFQYEHNGEAYKVEITKKSDTYVVKLDGRIYSLRNVLERGAGLIKFELNRQPVKARVASSGALRHIFIGGNVFQLRKVPRQLKPSDEKEKAEAKAEDAAATGKIQSPINGKVIRVWVEPNSTVSAKQDLLIIEAMKMEHRIKSPAAGTVSKIHVKEGDQVELGSMLIELGLKGENPQKEAE